MRPGEWLSPVYAAPTKDFLRRVVVNGGARPTPHRARLYDDLIRGLMAAGVWNRLDGLWMTAAADAATASTNLVSSSFTLTTVSSPTFTVDQGYAGNGTTSYVNTNYNPSTQAINYALNGASMFHWNMDTTTNSGEFGSVVAPDQALTTADSSAIYVGINSSALPQATHGATGQGFIAGSRYNATNVDGWRNGTLLINQAAAASTVIPNLTITMGTCSPSIPAQFSPGQIGMGGYGGSITQAEMPKVYNVIHKYMQAVAGVA